MAFLTAHQPLPDRPFVPRQLLSEDAWGEIWRAEMEGKTVLLIAYTTPEGDALFEEAEGGLKRWQEVAGSACPHLLKIIEINESAIPYVIVEDPGHESLHQFASDPENEMTLKDQGVVALHLAKAVVEGEAYDVAPLGLTPTTIFRSTEDKDVPWKILPVAPRARLQCTLLAGGRYFPKECATVPTLTGLHVDSYSVAWLFAETYRRDFASPQVDPKVAIPYRSLRFVLENSLIPKGGVYNEPNVVLLGIDRWLKKQMAQDVAEYEAAEKDKKRGPALTWIAKKGAKTAAIFIGLAVGGAGGFFGVQYLLHQKKVAEKVPETDRNPEGAMEIYLSAFEKSDMAKLQKFAMNDLPDQTRDVINQIETLRRSGAISGLAEREVKFASTLTGRVAEVTLKDDSGDAFGELRCTLEVRANGEWSVREVYYRPLKFGKS